MIRAVLDANTIASGAARFEWLISDHLIEQIVRTLSKPYFLTQVPPEIHRATIAALQTEATRIAVTTTVSGVATHPEDDLVLAAAVSAAADYLVTGDKKLQHLGHYQGVAIVSPRAFLTLLEEQAGEQNDSGS